MCYGLNYGKSNNNNCKDKSKDKECGPVAIAIAICIPIIILFMTALWDEYVSFWYFGWDEMFSTCEGDTRVFYTIWSRKYKGRTFDKFMTKLILLLVVFGITFTSMADCQYLCTSFIVIFIVAFCYYVFKKTVAAKGIERMCYIQFRNSIDA